MLRQDLRGDVVEGEEAALVGLGVLLLALPADVHEVAGEEQSSLVEADVVPPQGAQLAPAGAVIIATHSSVPKSGSCWQAASRKR